IVVEAFFPSQTVKIYGFKPYVVLTQSMEPEINVDDVVIVNRPDTDALEEGDIITFHADINNDGEKNIVTHYIYSIEEDASGDIEIRTRRHYEDPDNISPDPWVVTEDDVLGSYLFTVPNVGVVIRFLQSPFGLAALAVNALIIGAIVVLLKGDKNHEKTQDKT
ncbi:MAG: signal peptidase I, partial [Bacillota bacterium]